MPIIDQNPIRTEDARLRWLGHLRILQIVLVICAAEAKNTITQLFVLSIFLLRVHGQLDESLKNHA